MSAAAAEGEQEFRVLIAGGGVAGLEAILALREIELSAVEIELISPAPEFVLAPLSVVEPFGAEGAPEVDLAEFCSEHDVAFTRAGLAEVWPEERRVLTEDGVEMPYDALLLCTGARRRPVLTGALNFRGSGDSERLEELVATAREAGSGRIAFVVPDQVSWPLPLYELVLQTANRLRDTEVEIAFLTPEPAPLHVFGSGASRKVETMMIAAGIELRYDQPSAAGTEAASAADWAVSVPALEVPEIPGLNQVSHGFVPTDTRMRVQGADRVWAVGDMTWSPIKQGGIAAQQADVAAADVAATAGCPVEVPAYAPVLRAALMTADGPFYLRSGTDGDGGQRAPLWWPPAKVAGRLLAPYLARKLDPSLINHELLDLEADQARDVDHGEALELALRWADVDAAQGEYRRALHWIEVAEGLNIVVPDEYRDKRREWERQADEPD